MKKATDLYFVSWLSQVKQIDFDEFRKTDRRRGEWYYDMADEKWQALRVEFYKSDVSKVKAGLETLKDLFY